MTQQCSTTTHRKALELAAYSDRWSSGTARTITGSIVAVNLFASESEEGKVWLTRVDGAGCNCRGAQQSRSGICFHMVACALVTERTRAAFAAPTDVYDDDESLRYAF